MHEHTLPKKCKHDLKHCDHCDIVFCEKCKTEWKQPEPLNFIRKFQEDYNRKTTPYIGDPFNPPNRITYMAHNHSGN